MRPDPGGSSDIDGKVLVVWLVKGLLALVRLFTGIGGDRVWRVRDDVLPAL
jgi:hypothetical protein